MLKNKIRTGKYSLITFLPKNLLNQFSKMPNVYFAVICVMQCIKSISISNGQPAMALPLGVIVFISMLKDAYEDYKRHQADKSENLKNCKVYDPLTKKYISKRW
jgi:phospholipid-transporting ATPase